MAIIDAKSYHNKIVSKGNDSNSRLYEEGMAKIEKLLDANLQRAYPGWYIEVFLDTDTMRGDALENIRLKLESMGYLVITYGETSSFTSERSSGTVRMNIIVYTPDEPAIYLKCKIKSILPRDVWDRKFMLSIPESEGISGLVLDIIRETIRKKGGINND